MIYPNNYESKIGFQEIKNLLSGFCQSELGRERVGELQMLTEVSSIRQKLQET
jgi:DNA mismatch repair protein MutS2